jgi:hypothetical protein
VPFTTAHPAAAVSLHRPLGRFRVLSTLILGSMTPDFVCTHEGSPVVRAAPILQAPLFSLGDYTICAFKMLQYLTTLAGTCLLTLWTVGRPRAMPAVPPPVGLAALAFGSGWTLIALARRPPGRA